MPRASYFNEIDMSNLKTQCATAKNLFSQESMNVGNIQDVVRELIVLKSAFIQLLKLIAITLRPGSKAILVVEITMAHTSRICSMGFGDAQKSRLPGRRWGVFM